MQAITVDTNKVESPVDKKVIAGASQEYLTKGIWPRSIPLWMAAFYVSLYIIRPWEKLLPWLGEIHFERIYALCMITVVMLSQKKQFKMTFQSFSVVLFLGGISLSALFAWDTSFVWDNFYRYLTIVIFYFILIMVMRTPYELVFVVICYIVTMEVYLAKSLWEFFVHGAHRYSMGVVRMVGIERTFGGPNSLSMSIAISLPMLLFLWSERNELSKTWPRFWRKWFPRFLFSYFVLALISIALTNSRSGMLSVILFVLLIAFRGRGFGRKLGYILLGTLMLTFLWQVMPEEKRGRFRTIWNPEVGPASAYSSAMGRIEGLQAGSAMFSRFPLTGVGLGNFIPYRVPHVDGVPRNAHSLVGQVLGETGLLGSLPFLLLVSVVLANCRKGRILARSRSDSTLKVLSDLSLSSRDAVLFLAFEGLFDHNLLRFNWLWLAAFSCLAVQFIRQQLSETNPEEKA
jgi:hypothetical protein